jgi:hypothetical protein
MARGKTYLCLIFWLGTLACSCSKSSDTNATTPHGGSNGNTIAAASGGSKAGSAGSIAMASGGTGTATGSGGSKAGAAGSAGMSANTAGKAAGSGGSTAGVAGSTLGSAGTTASTGGASGGNGSSSPSYDEAKQWIDAYKAAHPGQGGKDWDINAKTSAEIAADPAAQQLLSLCGKDERPVIPELAWEYGGMDHSWINPQASALV